MSSTHYNQTIHDHGEMLANIPAILGFYPEDSVVFTFFVLGEDEQQPTFELGPIARIDLDDATEHLQQENDKLRAWCEQLQIVASMVYVITDDSNDPRIDTLIAALSENDTVIPSVLSITYTAQIVSDEPWHVLYSAGGADCADDADNMPTHGTIESITKAAVIQHMINDAQDLPSLNRDEVMALLNSTDHGLDDDLYADIIDDVAAYTRPDIDTPGAKQRLRREYEQASVGINSPHDPRALCAALKCFNTPMLRDPLIAALLDQPDKGFAFITQLLRTVPVEWPRVRAQVTAVLAILAHATYRTGLACHAAHHAQRINDKDSLSNLVAQIITIGRGDELTPIVREGAVLSRNKLLD